MRIGYATIQGFTHRNLEYNNQDSVLVIENDKFIIGLIADGCGSAPNSEVGAQLGLKYLSKRISERINSNWKKDLKEDLQNYSMELANLHSNNPQKFINDFLLYTVIGFVAKDNILTVFSYGDGVIIIDTDIEIIDQNNKPKYINNELIGNEAGEFVFKQITFDKQRIVLGSDGLIDLLEGIENGMIEEYQSFEEFINDDDNFINPITLSKLVQKYSRKGVLKDNCTLIMLME